MPKDLHVGFAALLQSVRHINVALVKCGAWKQARPMDELDGIFHIGVALWLNRFSFDGKSINIDDLGNFGPI